MRVSAAESRMNAHDVSKSVIDRVKGSPAITADIVEQQWQASQSADDPPAALATRLKRIAGVK
jgi:hypothetical protein